MDSFSTSSTMPSPPTGTDLYTDHSDHSDDDDTTQHLHSAILPQLLLLHHLHLHRQRSDQHKHLAADSRVDPKPRITTTVNHLAPHPSRFLFPCTPDSASTASLSPESPAAAAAVQNHILSMALSASTSTTHLPSALAFAWCAEVPSHHLSRWCSEASHEDDLDSDIDSDLDSDVDEDNEIEVEDDMLTKQDLLPTYHEIAGSRENQLDVKSQDATTGHLDRLYAILASLLPLSTASDESPSPMEKEPVPPSYFEKEQKSSDNDNQALALITTTDHHTPQTTLIQDLQTLAHFTAHQIHTLRSALYDLYLSNGSTARPSWNLSLQFGLHILRGNLGFQGASIPMARRLTAVGVLGQTRPPRGVTVTEVQVPVDLDELVKFEEQGNVWRRGKKAGHYPTVPPETRAHAKTLDKKYTLAGEWLQDASPALTTMATKTTNLIPNWAKPFIPSFDRSPAAISATTPPTTSQNSTATTTDEAPSAQPRASRKVIYYLHGGAYIFGSAKLYRTFTGRIAKETGCKVFCIQYRVAPEARFPTALHDAFAGYLYLTNPTHPSLSHLSLPVHHEPIAPSDIILMGDSAGGGLAMALLNYLNLYTRNPDSTHQISLPGGVALLSPWVDLTFTAHSWRTNAKYDWLPGSALDIHAPVSKDIPHPVYCYLYGQDSSRPISHLASLSSSPNSPDNDTSDPSHTVRDTVERFVRHPLVSPIFAESYADLPPLLIQSGDAEVLRDETLALAYKYATHNPTPSPHHFVRHELYRDMVHVFQAMTWLEASRVALASVRQFIEDVDMGRIMTGGEVEGVEVDSHIPVM
ncbi:hypothetical protein DFS34DRAFT_618262 [Phlyctochytrium arcticum]|nr:hypothetical protein DFS34DRAFT_618262 [Phlyctochytrium arcticum]